MDQPQTTEEQNHSGGSPYCADPDCPYCRELRDVTELVRNGKRIPPRPPKFEPRGRYRS